MVANAVARIVVAGGGLAGWSAALSLARFLKSTPTEIVLIAPPAAPKPAAALVMGPVARTFHDFCQIREEQLLKRCYGTFRLGTKLDAWGANGAGAFLPFGLHGAPIERADFYACWLRLGAEAGAPLGAFCISERLAEAAKFARMDPASSARSPLARFEYGYHLDHHRYVDLLRESAQQAGVKSRLNRVTAAEVADGNITGLMLDDGERISADFYLDCTGANAVLAGALALERDSFAQHLPGAGYVSARTDADNFEPFNRMRPVAEGVVEQVPLQYSVMERLVYSAGDEAAAETAMAARLPSGTALTRVELTPPGALNKPWRGNCLALGASAGHFNGFFDFDHSWLLTSLSRLFACYPRHRFNAAETSEYNRTTLQEAQRCRDFINMACWGRKDKSSSFWRAVATQRPAAGAAHRLAVFREKGMHAHLSPELVADAAWVSLFECLGHRPKAWDLRAEDVSRATIKAAFGQMQDAIKQVVDGAPPHANFVRHEAFAAPKLH